MATLNRFSPAASFGDKFFGMSAKERVVGVPANSLSGGFTVPDRERAGTKHFYLGDDGGLPQASQTMQISATTPLLAPEGSPLTTTPADNSSAPVASAKPQYFMYLGILAAGYFLFASAKKR